jgi:hypothetical protein
MSAMATRLDDLVCHLYGQTYGNFIANSHDDWINADGNWISDQDYYDAYDDCIHSEHWTNKLIRMVHKGRREPVSHMLLAHGFDPQGLDDFFAILLDGCNNDQENLLLPYQANLDGLHEDATDAWLLRCNPRHICSRIHSLSLPCSTSPPSPTTSLQYPS